MLHFLFRLYPLQTEQKIKFQEQIFTPQTWSLLKIFLSVIALFASLLVFYILKKQKTINLFLQKIKQEVTTLIQNFKLPFLKLNSIQKRNVVLLFCIILIFNIYKLYTSILHIDEAFSYVHFSSKGFFVSALYYPNPNNHIFFNELVSFWEIFWQSKFWAVKTPSFIAFCLIQVFLFRYLLVRFGFDLAVLGVIFFSFLSPVQGYGMSGRGYLLQMVFYFVCLWSLERGLKNTIEKMIFITASILGFYTIPTFLYVFVGMSVVLWRMQGFKTTFGLSSIILGITFFLYLPVYVLNGKGNLLSESWQQEAQKQFEEGLEAYWLDFADFWIGIENTYSIFYSFLFLCLIISLFKWREIRNRGLEIQLVIVVNAILLMLFQQRLLPVRIWMGFNFLWVIWLLSVLQVFRPFWQKIFLGMLITLQIAAQIYQKREQNHVWAAYKSFEESYPTLPFQTHEKVFSNDLVYQNLLSFYNIQDNKKLVVDYSLKDKSYDWLILDKTLKIDILLSDYEIFKENAYVKIWRRKGEKYDK
ncbi:MAG: hypothetical protein MUC49_02745 [Raineya sp.]|nr:hypothetical protein [Raineya sp.]